MRSALLVILLVGGVWYFFRHFDIDGLDGLQIRSNASLSDAAPDAAEGDFISWQDGGTPARSVSYSDSTGTTTGDAADSSAAGPTSHWSRRVRVGSWALGGFGRDKAAKPHVMGLLAQVVRDFDVIAVQQITGSDRDLLPRIVEHVNRSGRQYDFLLGPPPARHANPYGVEEQLAFIFDTERIVTDRGQFYTVADPGEGFVHDPIVAWFRVVGPNPAKAWTFSVVNVRLEMQAARQEVAALSRVLAAVSNDGRHEDDTLLAGLFQADDAYLLPSVGDRAIVAAVEATPTDIFGRHQVSNLLMSGDTTTEFLGSGGVVNYLRIHNLTLAECEELTPHLPVYGEFSPVEGL